MGGMPPLLTRVPKSPMAIAWVLYGSWRRLPPAQRRQLLDAARRHGPRVASAAAAAATATAKAKVAKRQKSKPDS
jgi:hypothetical protein